MTTKKFSIALLILFAFLFSSCIDLKQVTHINKDGSGIITIYYSTKLANLSMGDELGDFAFSEIKAKNFLTSANSDVRELQIESKQSDSAVYVTAIINFADFNKLNTAKSFSKLNTIWERTSEGYKFAYIINKDSVKISNFGEGPHYLNYEFEFPGEVVSSNGKTEGRKVKWTTDLNQLRSGIEMTATVEASSGVCGMFGFELPIILMLAGLFFLTMRNFRSSKKILSSE